MRDEFDELLELEKENRESKDIQKRMNLYFYKRITIFAVIFTLVLGCLYIVNPFKENNSYYDPTTLTIEGLDNQTSLGLVLSSFYRTQYSGVEIGIHDIKKESHKSILDVQEISDLYSISYGDEDELTDIIFDKGKANFKHRFSIWLDEYGKKDELYNLNKELSDLNDLPDSSILEVAVTFEKAISSYQLIELMKEYSDVHFVWGCVGKKGQMSYGINLDNKLMYDVNDQFETKYPYLNDFNKYDAKQLQQHYLSSLKILMDYPDLLECIEENYKSFEERYNESKDELSFIGVKCYIKKNDFMKAIQSGDFKYGFIEDIRYSKYEK